MACFLSISMKASSNPKVIIIVKQQAPLKAPEQKCLSIWEIFSWGFFTI